MTRNINNVLIYGFGVMGRGVAKTFAAAGYNTMVKTRRPVPVSDVLPGVTMLQQLPEQAPDLIIELVAEDVATKRAIYAEIEAAYPHAGPILATGTSGLDLNELAAGLKKPESFLGLHYFMPADKSLVVEVMAGPSTPADLVDLAAQVMEKTGKEPIRLYKPTIGFLLNRLQHAILHEAYCLIQEGVASAAEIDHAARRLLAPRMCLNGLIQQKDISGLKIHAEAQRSIVPSLFHNGIPGAVLQDMVARGETGLSAGKGFYDWSGCNADAVRSRSSANLQKLMDFLDHQLPPGGEDTEPKTRDLSRQEANRSAVRPQGRRDS
jgi:3-hydroxybutyryl-CoA dehydrogenase